MISKLIPIPLSFLRYIPYLNICFFGQNTLKEIQPNLSFHSQSLKKDSIVLNLELIEDLHSISKVEVYEQEQLEIDALRTWIKLQVLESGSLGQSNWVNLCDLISYSRFIDPMVFYLYSQCGGYLQFFFFFCVHCISFYYLNYFYYSNYPNYLLGLIGLKTISLFKKILKYIRSPHLGVTLLDISFSRFIMLNRIVSNVNGKLFFTK